MDVVDRNGGAGKTTASQPPSSKISGSHTKPILPTSLGKANETVGEQVQDDKAQLLLLDIQQGVSKLESRLDEFRLAIEQLKQEGSKNTAPHSGRKRGGCCRMCCRVVSWVIFLLVVMLVFLALCVVYHRSMIHFKAANLRGQCPRFFTYN